MFNLILKDNDKKRFFLMAACVMAAAGAMAQGNGQGYHGSHADGDFVFRSRHEIDLCHRCGGGLIGGVKRVRKFSSGDPGYVEDGGELVRSLYFPDCRRYYPALFLPVNKRVMNFEINKDWAGTGVQGLESQYLSCSPPGCLPCSWCSLSCT